MTVFLLALACLLFAMAACATPEQTTAAIAAAGATATALVQALSPLLPPEELAKLQATAANIDGTVEATATAVRTVCDAIVQLKGNVGAQIAQHAEQLGKATLAMAQAPTREEVYLVSGGTAAAGTGASRLLSHFKHTKGAARGSPA